MKGVRKMKLVELLARELKAWPECVSITQDYNGDVGLYSISNPTTFGAERAVWKFGGHIRNIAHLRRVASDRATAIVTRADWTAERARIAKPAKKADKDGWIRHRGGKCPVDGGAVVEVRDRDGDVYRATASELRWTHGVGGGDIMAYRLHKPAEQVEACSKPDPRDSAKRDSDCVCWMRDRITEIDATTQALTSERAELAQKLDSEGFALIERPTDSAAVLPRDQWKVGDLVVRVSDGEESGMPLNEPMKITFFDGSNRGQDVEVGGKYFPNVSSLLWHSRPSA